MQYIPELMAAAGVGLAGTLIAIRLSTPRRPHRKPKIAAHSDIAVAIAARFSLRDGSGAERAVHVAMTHDTE